MILLFVLTNISSFVVSPPPPLPTVFSPLPLVAQMGQLASLARLTHERHYNSLKFNPSSELFVPGGQVLGLACSAAARDLHEVLHEELLSVTYVNEVSWRTSNGETWVHTLRFFLLLY